jgi:hypothetical protein
MPDMLKFPDGTTRPVATYDELLEFVNKGRAAGAATLLEELIPSEPNRPSQCLIANALNFGCSVNGNDGGWYMQLPGNMDMSRVEAIAEALGCSYWHGNWSSFINLPEHIGNAAAAFDAGIAFTDLVAGD